LYYLEVDALSRHPRVPTLRVEINGHQGDFYFAPRVSWALGDELDAFDPIHSEQQKRITIPARFLRSGENRLTLTAIDDPSTNKKHVTAGGPGDSGFYYDAMTLLQSSEAVLKEHPEATLEPTIFFRNTPAGLEEECWLTVQYMQGWGGARVHVARGGVSAQVTAAKRGEFGEARVPVYISSSAGAGNTQMEFSNTWAPGSNGPMRQSFNTDFKPRKRWKIFYAPEEHLNVGYTDYQAKVVEVHSRVLDQLPEVLAAHPDYRFNVDGSWVMREWLETRDAEQAGRLAAAGRAGCTRHICSRG
jgi:hypothetical protein